ncbi:MAG: hypothetical protein ACRCXZ_02660 [Patescibacteria group bacterium]
MKFNLKAFALGLFATAIAINDKVTSLAQNNPTQIYEYSKNAIGDAVINITNFILMPIGALMIIINIILIIWSLVSGEKGKIGGRIAGIIFGVVLIVIAVVAATNKDTLFGAGATQTPR